MTRWQVHEAKARFSELLEQAAREGPQIIAKRGTERAVVLTIDGFGIGLAQIPRPGIEPLLASGQLVEVLPQWRPAPLPVSIIYSHNRHLSPRVRVFVDWLAEILKLK